MGFSNGSFCKIKEVVEKHDNYSVCKITVTKKNKLTNEYELQFSAHCRFVGNAHKSVPMKDQRIKITSCDVTNCYKDKDGNLQFTKIRSMLCSDMSCKKAKIHRHRSRSILMTMA